MNVIAAWLGSPDTNCAACYVITGECLGKDVDLDDRQRSRLRSHMQFCGGWEHQRVRRTLTAILSHYKRYIWAHAAFDHRSDSLMCFSPVCRHDTAPPRGFPLPTLRNSECTVSETCLHLQIWRCGRWWDQSVCATVSLVSCLRPSWKEPRVWSAACPGRRACPENLVPAVPRERMGMWVSREEMAEMAERVKREKRETQVYHELTTRYGISLCVQINEPGHQSVQREQLAQKSLTAGAEEMNWWNPQSSLTLHTYEMKQQHKLCCCVECASLKMALEYKGCFPGKQRLRGK